MHSRDRECAHHHNGEDFALKGKMSIFAVFFFYKTGFYTDMKFVQNFTPPDFQVKNFTPPISPNFNSFSKKKHKK